ncbi:MAG: 3-oxoacyl-ACP synthase III family protein [Clostridia bacterium]|nr:3-oxoacyl-ACP synthase III family protein [Clostridia bacterium]
MNEYQKDFNAGIVALGKYLPEKRMTEEDFIKAGVPKESLDKWGVYEHRVSDINESPSDMSIKAARNLIESNNIDPKEIDLIIDCAFIPDYIHPGNSHRIQYELGANKAATIDIVPSSGGVVPQLIMAEALIKSQTYNNALITCSSKFTSVADKTDLFSLVLAGDGAAAALVSKTNKETGILSSNLITRGEFHSNSGIKMKKPLNSSNKGMVYEDDDSKLLFYIDNAYIFSDNQDKEGTLDKFILNSVPLSSKIALEKINMSYDDVDFWITHQNVKVLREHWLEVVGAKAKGNYYYSADKYGNLYNVNLLVNLIEAAEKSYISESDIVVLGGLTSGYSTGTIVMKWGM